MSKLSIVYKNGDVELAAEVDAPADITNDDFKRNLLAPALTALQMSIDRANGRDPLAKLKHLLST